MVLTRLASALVLIPLTLLLLYAGGVAFLVLVLLAAGLASYEFYAMFRQSGRQPAVVPGVVLAMLVVALSYPDVSRLAGGVRVTPSELPAGVLTIAILIAIAYALIRGRASVVPVSDWAVTLAGILYVGWLIRYALLLRSLPWGWEWSLLALVSTWASDTGAFFTGRMIGRHKLWPSVSPGKTWEGVLGATALTLFATVVGGTALLNLTLWQCALLGVLITAASVVGDLAESMLKRAAGVKDSGELIPGHGGLLDRIDSLLFVLPVVYFFAVWLMR